ncbi:membrane protein insertase YidC, partial [Leptospira sp. SA-E8]|uniref:membrane protein insertase YidC n=1 Tax=Leptospira sp. SA-E8 TaxID=3422259 RepID=UPI003EC122E1
MNDIRRTILWVIFGFSIVLLWDQWQIHNGRSATFFPSPTAAAAKPSAQPATGAATNGVPAAVTSSAASAGVLPTTAAAVAAERVQVQTDVFDAVLDGKGGTLARLELLHYLEEK